MLTCESFAGVPRVQYVTPCAAHKDLHDEKKPGECLLTSGAVKTNKERIALPLSACAGLDPLCRTFGLLVAGAWR